MTQFVSKRIVIDAIQWQGGNYDILDSFCGRNWARADAVGEAGPNDDENIVIWNTCEKQWLNAPVGHWIIRGAKGELYPCDPDIFALKYESYPPR